ncbi:class I SAM-dependent methyltransferase, partial [Limnoraphis robusta CCNP1324]|uniref:class I SAM-dependent methyltransferase n=1 Tax=Limnoraphis robusta TaxID=1118279 RepID=UPI002B21716A
MSTKSTSEIFTSIFRDDAWRGKSKSGPGSTLAATAVLRAALPGAFQALGIRTLMDAPCGTAEWVTEVTGDLDTYIGCDVVEELVWAAARDNTRRNHFFTLADITLAILPRADAILCRDCLVYMPLEMAATTIA